MELPPRGNMRHSPDVARGYLMWFYYNGFIHYAGEILVIYLTIVTINRYYTYLLTEHLFVKLPTYP